MDKLIYICLAKESPARTIDSDEDFYNSLNEQETDFCHDSSDATETDSDSQFPENSEQSYAPIDTIATMEVLEYEVATASDSSEASKSSSSGTGDHVLAAFAQAAADNSSASEFAILADTEESDDTSQDSDFTPADYWQCVKCKNKQNNPMYRFCERCYQPLEHLFFVSSPTVYGLHMTVRVQQRIDHATTNKDSTNQKNVPGSEVF
ncbi:uncharacterized protein LOC129748947 isoform X2 [Uranotaenia lowii]|uniref:uncharacterized protein LOC129748947 isoform X2 n=1 Tax=Uranotaenia lowii TaxID=190385 RepID=UPI0024789AC7|nr:uncharacterized protein LOC129748947 isoform X2 [Uranotaenia lowii]